MEAVFMNTEDHKTNEPHQFILNLSQRLDLSISDKHVALQNLSINYTWKNMMNLSYQMVLILFQILKVISNISLKSMKH